VVSESREAATSRRTEEFASFDGTRIAYRLYGDDTSLTPLFFCSGIACDEMYWIQLANDVGRERLVVTWDYPYHGDSGPAGNEGEITVASMAHHAGALINHIGISRAVFAGHSMGVQVLLEAYRLYPASVAGMIMIAGPYQHTVGHLYGTDIGRWILTLIELGAAIQPRLAQFLWTLAVTPEIADPIGRVGGLVGPAPAESMVRYFEHLGRLDVGILAKMFKEGQEHSAEDLLEHIAVPVLLLHGTNDVMTPLGLAEEMAERIPDAELVAVEGGAHTLPIEDPDLISRETRRFLSMKVDRMGN
jgi:pimeloyl-ACP methyl ester carboxylesterase